MNEPWTLTILKADRSWINSNQRTHRMVHAKHTAEWRRVASWLVHWNDLKPAAPFEGRVRVIATFHKNRLGRWDAGNLYPTAKAILDGIVDAGVLVDDDNLHVIGPDMRAGEKRAQACVVIRIEPA